MRVTDFNHKLMRTQYKGSCKVCKVEIPKDTKVVWSSRDKVVYHQSCFENRFN